MQYSGIEMLIVQTARQIREKEIIFAGVGLPIISMAVAKRFYQPDITIICESGVVDTVPTRLAMSIADPSLVANCKGLFTPREIFSYFLQGGRIDVGVLGGAQVDRLGSINSTVIGPYDSPSVRMPGSGGACEIAVNAKEIIIVMPQGKRRFVEKIDFVTSPGHIKDPNVKRSIPGKGPRALVSDLGLYEFDAPEHEMVLKGLYQGISYQSVCDNTGWNMKTSPDVKELAPPSKEELEFIRRLDPDGIFLGKQG